MNLMKILGDFWNEQFWALWATSNSEVAAGSPKSITPWKYKTTQHSDAITPACLPAQIARIESFHRKPTPPHNNNFR